jgi:hypothetical protein
METYPCPEASGAGIGLGKCPCLLVQNKQGYYTNFAKKAPLDVIFFTTITVKTCLNTKIIKRISKIT